MYGAGTSVPTYSASGPSEAPRSVASTGLFLEPSRSASAIRGTVNPAPRTVRVLTTVCALNCCAQGLSGSYSG